MGRLALLAIGWSLCLLTAGCAGFVGGGASTYNATVTDVVDGDTVDVRLENGSTRTVRLLGVDSPEVYSWTNPEEFAGVPDTDAGGRCLHEAAETARAFLHERVAGDRIQLKTDPAADHRGDYGRLLVYLYTADRNLNYDLIEGGHARVFQTHFSERVRFEQAATDARSAHRGLWQCRDP